MGGRTAWAAHMASSVGFLDTTMRILEFLLSSFLLLSPMLLLGLFLAGVIHVLISKAAVLRWLSSDSLKSVCISSAVGVPIPLCSCSVVPVVKEMRNKGASRSSCISFLITAPETGADSILVTHAFFGFVAAVVRPVVSFVTAVVTGIFCIGLNKDDSHRSGANHSGKHDHDGDECADEHAACSHDHGTHTPLMTASEDCYVSPSQLKSMVVRWVLGVVTRAVRSIAGVRAASWVKPSFYLRSDRQQDTGQAGGDVQPDRGEDRPSLGKVCRHVVRYGFVEVADDILFALVVGILLGGVLFLAIPDGFMSSDYARWISYPVMVIVGIPLYICASASTPVAAALVAKGLSPGAALIFLMTGPATNSGTIAIIISQFGARFASIYVFGVIAVTTLIGIVIDLTLIGLGLTLPVTLSSSGSPAIQLVEWTAAIVLLSLIVWRFRAGAMRTGYQDLVSNLAPMLLRCRQAWESRPIHRGDLGR